MAYPEVPTGWVQGRLLSTRLGQDFDSWRGTVKLAPVPDIRRETGDGYDPATVSYRSILLPIGADGRVELSEVPVARYQVSFTLAVGKLRGFHIQVTAEHTKEDPLDLTLAAPIETPPGFTEVVRIVDRVRAEDAAENAEHLASNALVYRDEAAQSAASAQAHSASAGESADAAGSHADRAETARDETLAQAIEVDTSVGTRVFIGGHMVHGSTGWRDVTALFSDGLSPDNNGTIEISRNGPDTVLTLNSITLLEGDGAIQLGTLPSGFRPVSTRFANYIGARNNDISRIQLYNIFNGILSWVSTMNVRSGGFELSRPTSSVSGSVTYTSGGWPTSLPGTPA